MHITSRITIFCLLVIIGMSCSVDPNTQQSYQMEPFADNPRVFYGETGYPTEDESPPKTCESLSTEEINLVQKLISEKTQKPIWFVRLPLRSSKDHRNQIWVYLAPDVMNTRYRSGQAYTLEIYDKYLGGEVRSISDSSWQYVQVSLPNKEFSSVLKTPEVHDLPFRYPSQGTRGSENKQDILSQKEIISLLDYIRDPNNYLEFDVVSSEKLPNGILLITPPPMDISEDVVTKPLVSIKKYSDEIIVNFGFIHGPLYARCIRITLKKTKDSYEIIGWGLVIS